MEATHGERNLASVVAFAIASVEPGSGVSVGASGFCAAKIDAQSRNVIAQANFMEVSIGRVKFTIAGDARQLDCLVHFRKQEEIAAGDGCFDGERCGALRKADSSFCSE